jgi:hypothetical protein
MVKVIYHNCSALSGKSPKNGVRGVRTHPTHTIFWVFSAAKVLA